MDGTINDQAWPTAPTSPGKALERIVALTRPYATDVSNVDFICNKLISDSILCTVTVMANASLIGSAIGGIVYGTTLVCRAIGPLTDEVPPTSDIDTSL